MLSACRFEFKAMGSPCEIRLYAHNSAQASEAISAAVGEINRLEEKYSRFKNNNLFAKVNAAAADGASIDVDDEFISLLEFADSCYQQSGGLFDITSGVLRKAWRLDETVKPDELLIHTLLEAVGWQHISWKNRRLHFAKKHMEIDFGGIVKEYAADCAAAICQSHNIHHGMIDMGGDINVLGPHLNADPWVVHIRHPRKPLQPMASLEISHGGLASSGDYERFIEIAGEKYNHILSPKTGWPVRGLAAVTTIASRCVIAGSACTIAMLKERRGPQWLDQLGIPYLWMDVDQTYDSGNMQCLADDGESSNAIHWLL